MPPPLIAELQREIRRFAMVGELLRRAEQVFVKHLHHKNTAVAVKLRSDLESPTSRQGFNRLLLPRR